MGPSRGRGVAGYVEVFVLIGVALGGSAVVLGAASQYGSSLRGASVEIADVSVIQGPYLALEKVAVYNDGQAPISSFTVSTPLAPGTASYCVTLANPGASAVVTTTCPAMTQDPRRVSVAYALPPGGAVLVEMSIQGGSFAIGSALQVTVTTSSGAQDSAAVQVLPA